MKLYFDKNKFPFVIIFLSSIWVFLVSLSYVYMNNCKAGSSIFYYSLASLVIIFSVPFFIIFHNLLFEKAHFYKWFRKKVEESLIGEILILFTLAIFSVFGILFIFGVLINQSGGMSGIEPPLEVLSKRWDVFSRVSSEV